MLVLTSENFKGLVTQQLGLLHVEDGDHLIIKKLIMTVIRSIQTQENGNWHKIGQKEDTEVPTKVQTYIFSFFFLKL